MNPAEALINLAALMTPGGIEAQEKHGQMEQAHKQTLPRKHDRREQWEALGFVFGEQVDDLFVEVTFPEGWKKEPTDHSMWSNVVDDKGRKRGSIFYKAAFYDRDAHCNLNCRFSVTTEYPDNKLRFVRVTDECGKVSVISDAYDAPDWQRDRKKARETSDALDAEHKRLCAWLDENYPEWKDPTKYWDESGTSEN